MFLERDNGKHVQLIYIIHIFELIISIYLLMYSYRLRLEPYLFETLSYEINFEINSKYKEKLKNCRRLCFYIHFM